MITPIGPLLSGESMTDSADAKNTEDDLLYTYTCPCSVIQQSRIQNCIYDFDQALHFEIPRNVSQHFMVL